MTWWKEWNALTPQQKAAVIVHRRTFEGILALKRTAQKLLRVAEAIAHRLQYDATLVSPEFEYWNDVAGGP